MKRTLTTMIGVLALGSIMWAQGAAPPPPPPPLEPGASQADVDKAVLAAPERLRGQATVIKWNTSNFTYTTLRKGTNPMVCFDRSGIPGQQAFSVECTVAGNLPRVAQNLKMETETDRAKRTAAFAAAEKDGTRVKPVFGGIWYRLQGADQATARTHTTIAVPGATGASLGLPENGKEGVLWVMDAGTSTAHLMIPGQ